MSETEGAGEVRHGPFPSGQTPSREWPFYYDYATECPPPPGIEAEKTSGYPVRPGEDYGFFTDTTLCIGCKACEVACKEWNQLPADHIEWRATSYDQTRSLGHSTWRHVKFIEQRQAEGERPRWLFQSDICKHCAHAGCLEACPTGAIVRTEYGSVLIQQDVCNGCLYCIPSCPFGVITLDRESDAKAHKCTFCYDRLQDGMEPACAKSCPTDSIQFGPITQLRARAQARVEALHDQGFPEAQLYGDPGGQGATNGVEALNSFFLLMDHPNVYGLPEAPKLPARQVAPGLLTSLAAGVLLIGATAAALLGSRR